MEKARPSRNILLRILAQPQAVVVSGLIRSRHLRCIFRRCRWQQRVGIGQRWCVTLVQRGWRAAQTIDNRRPGRFFSRDDGQRDRGHDKGRGQNPGQFAERPETAPPPPPPPMPRPPPSDRCSNTTAIRPRARMRWTIRTTFSMGTYGSAFWTLGVSRQVCLWGQGRIGTRGAAWAESPCESRLRFPHRPRLPDRIPPCERCSS